MRVLRTQAIKLSFQVFPSLLPVILVSEKISVSQYFTDRGNNMTVLVTTVSIETRHMIPRIWAMTLPEVMGNLLSARKPWILSWGGLATVSKETCSGNCGGWVHSLCEAVSTSDAWNLQAVNKGRSRTGWEPVSRSWNFIRTEWNLCLFLLPLTLWPGCPAEARSLHHRANHIRVTQESEKLRENSRRRQSSWRSSCCLSVLNWMSVCVFILLGIFFASWICRFMSSAKFGDTLSISLWYSGFLFKCCVSVGLLWHHSGGLRKVTTTWLLFGGDGSLRDSVSINSPGERNFLLGHPHWAITPDNTLSWGESHAITASKWCHWHCVWGGSVRPSVNESLSFPSPLWHHPCRDRGAPHYSQGRMEA